jgi:hypothetical protein
VAEPAASPATSQATSQATSLATGDTAPDASAAPAKVAEAAAEPASAGAFRETKWFKEGAAAEASALLDASKSAATGDTKGDTGQYSLQTGATKVMASVRDTKPSGDDVSSRELIKEMKSGRGKIVAAIVLVLVLVALIVVFAVTR